MQVSITYTFSSCILLIIYGSRCIGKVISGACDYVCVCVCARSKRKTARAINTKHGTHKT